MQFKKFQVAVTGIGIICANGKNVEEFWGNIIEGKSGIKLVKELDLSDLSTNYGGEVEKFIPSNYFTKKELLQLDRAGQFAVLAAREAVSSANIDFSNDPYRAGLILGTSLGGIASGEKFHEQWINKDINHTDRSLIFKYPIHVPADNVATDLGIKGPKSVISNACAAGTNSVGYALDTIRSGKADVMLAGGVDPLTKLSLSGFNSLQALCDGPCSPYSESNGVNIGEGAAFLVLERLDYAEARGAEILAEVLDYSLSADCYHQTAPDPAGSGALQSMKNVLMQAGYEPKDISYINGHGTGTPANDSSEPKALRSLLKEYSPPISSTKSMIGHMLGAAGAAEAVTSILAIKKGVIPPTVNFKEESSKFDLDFVPNNSRKGNVDLVLSNSFAFGGNNATIMFGAKTESNKPVVNYSKRRVVISGVGAIAGNASNVEEIYSLLKNGESGISEITEFDTSIYGYQDAGIIPEIKYGKFVNPKLLRKMDTISKQAAVATNMAIKDANIKINRDNSEEVGLIFATGTGPIETVEAFNRVVISEGAQKANARRFPNTVMNAAAGHIGLNFKLKGPTSTICAGGVSAINGLFYANSLIQQGICKQVIVVSSDEFNEPMLAGMHRIPGYLTKDKAKPFDVESSGNILGAGSVAFVLESDESAKERGAEIHAEIKGFGMTSDNSKIGRINPTGEAWEKSIELALAEAGLEVSNIGYIASSASGHKTFDAIESRVLSRVFGNDTPVSAPKSVFGETHGTAGAIGILSSILAFSGVVPAIQHLTNPNPRVELDLVTNTRRADVKNALINSFAYGGNYNSLVVSQYIQ
ncbi:beta-ketoacyl-[acyl-carrier-protein] synthase family protein [Bacillus sp. CH30_1T]|uniref:beta-ketoacyl-[acyl-carrier-protein] synthase family protein n=1 Tax=Bacillus sp. CH30_1T TaxID=2604836 RepID=UPI0011ED2900|nr:beta-ketoacyl-[acyl-carrier-protein] synthase family protein [Bacillus sp. CH30_1T]KAA0560846.1 beta-ketoacyl-[acyl-carrier-protein] synthase family protein [Bacillus sp. CH30_1T]